MPMNLSDRRWICVVTLAGVMLLSASEAESGPFMNKRCCKQVQRIPQPRNGKVQCWKQDPGRGCIAAYVILSNSEQKCVSPIVPWILRLLTSGELACPRLGLKRERFFRDALDEDDVE